MRENYDSNWNLVKLRPSNLLSKLIDKQSVRKYSFGQCDFSKSWSKADSNRTIAGIIKPIDSHAHLIIIRSFIFGEILHIPRVFNMTKHHSPAEPDNLVQMWWMYSTIIVVYRVQRVIYSTATTMKSFLNLTRNEQNSRASTRILLCDLQSFWFRLVRTWRREMFYIYWPIYEQRDEREVCWMRDEIECKRMKTIYGIFIFYLRSLKWIRWRRVNVHVFDKLMTWLLSQSLLFVSLCLSF